MRYDDFGRYEVVDKLIEGFLRMSGVKKMESVNEPRIERVSPAAAIYGGELEVRGTDFFNNGNPYVRARFGSVNARLVVSGSSHLIIRGPEEATDGNLILENGFSESKPYMCSLGATVADDLHPVSNPVVDLEGNIYTTRSGARGEDASGEVFKIDSTFTINSFAADIINPTGLVLDKSGNLFISSRGNGTIYSVDRKGQAEVYVEGMGIATGLAFDSEGNLYVGDRTGTIFKISPTRQIFVFATIEPSIAAYHLAMGPENELHVSGPTTSSFDSIYCVHPNGEVDVVCRGFGRPQGMVFDSSGNLYLAASHGGHKVVFLLKPCLEPERVVSGPGIVGLAFLPTGELVAATNSALYCIDIKTSSNNRIS